MCLIAHVCLCIHNLFIVVRRMFTICPPFVVRILFTFCSPCVHHLFAICSWFVTLCSLLFSCCPLFAHSSLTLVHVLFTLCSPVSTRCSLVVHSCSPVVLACSGLFGSGREATLQLARAAAASWRPLCSERRLLGAPADAMLIDREWLAATSLGNVRIGC